VWLVCRYVTPTPATARNVPRYLAPLPTPPVADPGAWALAAARGRGAVPVVDAVGDVEDLRAGLTRLIVARSRPLARISLGYGTRALLDIIDEITWWTGLPVCGYFFDHAPTSPYQVGPLTRAIRVARRAGLGDFVLNPGMAVDPIYRGLPATICTFEGTWAQYQARPAESFAPGDGHLVLDVPHAELPLARAMTLARGAGLFLATGATALFDESAAEFSEPEATAPPRQRAGQGPGYRNRPSRWERPGVTARAR